MIPGEYMVSMNRNKWLWIFVILSIINVISTGILATVGIHYVYDSFYVNIIRSPLIIAAFIALILAIFAKK